MPIHLSGETFYMSTLIKVMLFIPWHPISLYCGGGGTLSHTDSQFLYTRPAWRQGKLWNTDAIWGYILSVLETNVLTFHYTINLAKFFWPPLLLWKTFWSTPPPLGNSKLFGSPPFCSAPHQDISGHSLMGEILSAILQLPSTRE